MSSTEVIVNMQQGKASQDDNDVIIIISSMVELTAEQRRRACIGNSDRSRAALSSYP